MRTAVFAEHHASNDGAAESEAEFFCPDRANEVDPLLSASDAPGVARRRIDPLCALVYLVLIPFFCGWFWYAVYGLIRAAWRLF